MSTDMLMLLLRHYHKELISYPPSVVLLVKWLT